MNRNLTRWTEAGLIDAGTRRRIEDWEGQNASPTWIWALAGLGAFAVLLGLAAVVAANWDEIPGAVKIGAHLGLDLLAAVAVFVAWRRQSFWARELFALLLFGLVLSGEALVAQTYQLGGSGWQMLLFWMVLCMPFLAVLTRSRLAGLVWAAGAILTFAVAFPDLVDNLLSQNDVYDLLLAWIASLALMGLGALRGLDPAGRAQGGAIIWVGAVFLAFGASLIEPLLRLDGFRYLGFSLHWVVPAVAALLAVAVLDRWRHGRWDLILATLPLLSALCWYATLATAGRDLIGNSDFISDDPTLIGAEIRVALVFIVFWLVIGWVASREGRRGWVAAAFLMIVARLLAFFFEALGGLMSTGIGLAAGGAVFILLALGGRLLMRHRLAGERP